MKNKNLFGYVAWMKNCKRSVVLASYLNAATLFLPKYYSKNKKSRKFIVPVYYLVYAFILIIWLMIKRPNVVFAQAPPLFCPLTCLLYTSFFKKKIIVDCHNQFFTKLWEKTPGYSYLLRKANIVLVHNDDIYEYLSRKYIGPKFYPLPDKIVGSFKDCFIKEDKPYLLIVASYNYDEPLEMILQSAHEFLKNNSDYVFKITGNYNYDIALYERFNRIQGIEFLGFVDNDYYDLLLRNAYAVITLSTRKMIQQCASVESLSACVPMIISDSLTNRKLFGDSVVYTECNEECIIDAFKEIISKREIYKERIVRQKEIWEEDWDNRFAKLIEII